MEIFQLETYYGPLTLGAGLYPVERGSLLYWNFEDQNSARAVHVLSYVRYVAGSIDAGVGGFFWVFDEGPEGQVSTRGRVSTPPSTTSVQKAGSTSNMAAPGSSSTLRQTGTTGRYDIRLPRPGPFSVSLPFLNQEGEVDLHPNMSSHGGTCWNWQDSWGP